MIATVLLFVTAAALFVAATVRREHRVPPRGAVSTDRVSQVITVVAISTTAIACPVGISVAKLTSWRV